MEGGGGIIYHVSLAPLASAMGPPRYLYLASGYGNTNVGLVDLAGFVFHLVCGFDAVKARSTDVGYSGKANNFAARTCSVNLAASAIILVVF